MVALRHRGRPDERPIDVPEESVDYWSALGYAPVEDKATTPKKSAAGRSSTAKK